MVETTPSGPPSFTRTCPSCQIARVPSLIAPGTTASNVVVAEHVAPNRAAGGRAGNSQLVLEVHDRGRLACGPTEPVRDADNAGHLQLARVAGERALPAYEALH